MPTSIRLAQIVNHSFRVLASNKINKYADGNRVHSTLMSIVQMLAVALRMVIGYGRARSVVTLMLKTFGVIRKNVIRVNIRI